MQPVARTEAVVPSVDDVLTTTRAVRRRLDLERPVPREVIDECVGLAQQAPIAEATEVARFVTVDDRELRARMAAVYRHATEDFVLKPLAERAAARKAAGDEPRVRDPRFQRIMDSAYHLFERLHEVPVLVLAGGVGRPPRDGTSAHTSGFYGSVYPAIWSFQLALRSRGLGSSLTCIHLHYADEMAQVLGLPETFTQVALLPVAYTQGLDFKPAVRLPHDEVAAWNGWPW